VRRANIRRIYIHILIFQMIQLNAFVEVDINSESPGTANAKNMKGKKNEGSRAYRRLRK